MEYPKMAEAGQYPEARSQKTILATRFNPFTRREYKLVQATAGYEVAGSAMRYTNGYYAVRFELDGASHGRQFKTEAEARELFEQWSTRNS